MQVENRQVWPTDVQFPSEDCPLKDGSSHSRDGDAWLDARMTRLTVLAGGRVGPAPLQSGEGSGQEKDLKGTV
jgi:hypothetical protein